ncbi:HNH endonuclease [Halostagnicola bangensis]
MIGFQQALTRSRLLDMAHVLSWSDYPEYRADLTNVLPLTKTHHAAFDRGLYTIGITGCR